MGPGTPIETLSRGTSMGCIAMDEPTVITTDSMDRRKKILILTLLVFAAMC